MQLHSATAVEAARSTVRRIPRMPVLCTVPYPASYAPYRSLTQGAPKEIGVLVEVLEVGDQVVVVVSMRSGQRCIKRCEAANTAAGTSTILAK